MKELNFTGQRPWLFLPVTFFKRISLPHTFMTSSEQDQIPQCSNHIPPKNSFILKYDSSSRFSPNFHIKQPSMYLRSPANLYSVSSPAASSKRVSYGIIQEGVGSRDWTKGGKTGYGRPPRTGDPLAASFSRPFCGFMELTRNKWWVPQLLVQGSFWQLLTHVSETNEPTRLGRLLSPGKPRSTWPVTHLWFCLTSLLSLHLATTWTVPTCVPGRVLLPGRPYQRWAHRCTEASLVDDMSTSP